MNRERRNRLRKVIGDMEELKDSVEGEEAAAWCSAALDDLQYCRDEEEIALDNRPESMSGSAMNDAMNDNISDMDEAIDCLDTLISECEEEEIFDYDSVQHQVADVIHIVNTVINR